MSREVTQPPLFMSARGKAGFLHVAQIRKELEGPVESCPRRPRKSCVCFYPFDGAERSGLRIMHDLEGLFLVPEIRGTTGTKGVKSTQALSLLVDIPNFVNLRIYKK